MKGEKGMQWCLVLFLLVMLACPSVVLARGFDVGDSDTGELIKILKEKGLLNDEDVSKIEKRIEKQKGKASLKIQGRIQFRYTSIEDYDVSTNEIRSDANGFRLQRVRLVFKGTAVPRVEYFIHLNFDQGTDGHVWDTFIQYNFGPELGHIRLGQFKVPFSRQWLVSSTKFLLMNRAYIGDNLGFRRDIGIMYEKYSQFNTYQDAFAKANMDEPTINYAVGVFNGNHRANGNGFLSGSDSSARIGKGNDNDQYLYIGRVTYTPIKSKEGVKYLSLGANAGYQRKPTNGDKFILDDTAIAKFDVTSGQPWKYSDWEAAWGLDGELIVGQAVFEAEYIQRKLDTKDLLTFTNGKQGRSVTAKGWYVQGGYFVQPEKLSLNARYETYDPNDQVSSKNDFDRYTLGFNYYIVKNAFKVQGDYTWQDEKVQDLDNNYWEVQLQMLF
jgi:phosphate-selective porin OprO/OprP